MSIYTYLIVVVVIIQLFTSKIIKKFEYLLPVSIPSTLVILICAILNYYFILFFFNDNEKLRPSKTWFWIAATIGGICFAIFLFLYSKIPGVFNNYFKIINILLITFFVVASLSGKRACKARDLSGASFKTATAMFKLIILLGILTIFQYKFFDFLPLPYLMLNLKSFITLIKGLGDAEEIENMFKDVPEDILNMGFFDFNVCGDKSSFSPHKLFSTIVEQIEKCRDLGFWFWVALGVYCLITIGFFIGIFTLLTELSFGGGMAWYGYVIASVLGIINFYRYFKVIFVNGDDTNKLFKKTNAFLDPIITTLQLIALSGIALIVGVIVYIVLFFVLFAVDFLSVFDMYQNEFIFGLEPQIYCDGIRFVFEGWFYYQIGKFFYKTINIGIEFNQKSSPTNDCNRPKKLWINNKQVQNESVSYRSGIYSFLAKSKTFYNLMATISNSKDEPIFNEEVFNGRLDGFPLYQGLSLCNVNSGDKCKDTKLSHFFGQGTTQKDNNIVDIKKREYNKNVGAEIPKDGMISFKLLPFIYSLYLVYKLGQYSGFTKFIEQRLVLDAEQSMETFTNYDSNLNKKSKKKKIKRKKKPKPHKNNYLEKKKITK